MSSNLPDYLQKFAASAEGQQALQDAKNLASMKMSIPRISLKGRQFNFKVEGEVVHRVMGDVHLVILGVDPDTGRSRKTYYKDAYNSDSDSPPDCCSSNGVTPDTWVSSPMHTNCANCPMNAFGSGESMSGKKSKACRDSKILWVKRVEDMADPDSVVYGLDVPVMSLKSLSKFGQEVAKTGVPLAAHIVKVFMDPEAEYPKIMFENAGYLEEQYGVKALEMSAKREWPGATNADQPIMIATDNAGQAQISHKPAATSPVPRQNDASGVTSVSVDQMIDDWSEGE